MKAFRSIHGVSLVTGLVIYYVICSGPGLQDIWLSIFLNLIDIYFSSVISYNLALSTMLFISNNNLQITLPRFYKIFSHFVSYFHEQYRTEKVFFIHSPKIQNILKKNFFRPASRHSRLFYQCLLEFELPLLLLFSSLTTPITIFITYHCYYYFYHLPLVLLLQTLTTAITIFITYHY